VGYLVAVVLQVLVALISCLVLLVFPAYAFHGIKEVLTVALIAVSWGAGPAVLAAFVGLALEEGVVLPVQAAESRLTTSDLAEGALFLGVGICITVVAATTERSRRLAVEARAAERATVLLQAQDRMDEFLAIANQDLRLPLTALNGYLELATLSNAQQATAVPTQLPALAAQSERVRTDLAAAQESSEGLHRLVAVLFDTSRARAETRVTGAGDEVDRPADGPLELSADRERIGQIIANYLSNALKYAPASEPIEVSEVSAQGHARVAVRDRGPGLPAQEQEWIWQRFYRAEGIQAQSGAREPRPRAPHLQCHRRGPRRLG
jgi:signal transduction histidine kinase